MDNGFKKGNIAILPSIRSDNKILCDLVNVGDPRNSLVAPLLGDFKLVLTHQERISLVNIDSCKQSLTHENSDSAANTWPLQQLYLLKVDNSTADALIFDSEDFNDSDSLLGFTVDGKSTACVSDLIEKHNVNFAQKVSTELEAVLDGLMDSFSTTADNLDTSTNDEETNSGRVSG
ncbi:MAG: hypothetical protein HAW67_00730 [Endozoicomonadaceae bacterium]|nr:hypothetical protein [Endozoicomonadaceae bacterium]